MEESSDWRDWANHPVAITAIWPRVMASGMPPASCLALLGTCPRTRDAVLFEAPRVELTLQLGAEQPAPDPLLGLLRQSGRTQPTTLLLLPSSCALHRICYGRNPTKLTGAARVQSGLKFSRMVATRNDNPTLYPILTPDAASISAQRILSHPACAGSSCITRLDLQGIEVDPPLLKAMQHLPALTHLHLSLITLPAAGATYQPAELPQGVRTLHIQPVYNPPPEAAPLLTEFFMLDTITDLTVILEDGAKTAAACVTALDAVSRRGRQARALRKLCLLVYQVTLVDRDIEIVKRAAPLLEELQVFAVNPEDQHEEDGVAQVSWRTLHVSQLDLRCCSYLPLVGTEPLDIHVSSFKVGSDGDDLLLAGVRHLNSQQTRPVRLVGTGDDGGAFHWEGSTSDTDWAVELSVLQLSKAPVRKLSIRTETAIDVEQLLLALQSLPALTQLSLVSVSWCAADATGTHDKLLAQLPLHVQRVRLVSQGYNEMKELFVRMAAAASTVPGRQEQPLQLFIPSRYGVGNRDCQREVRQAVDGFRASGALGVVLDQSGPAWD